MEQKRKLISTKTTRFTIHSLTEGSSVAASSLQKKIALISAHDLKHEGCQQIVVCPQESWCGCRCTANNIQQITYQLSQSIWEWFTRGAFVAINPGRLCWQTEQKPWAERSVSSAALQQPTGATHSAAGKWGGYVKLPEMAREAKPKAWQAPTPPLCANIYLSVLLQACATLKDGKTSSKQVLNCSQQERQDTLNTWSKGALLLLCAHTPITWCSW